MTSQPTTALPPLGKPRFSAPHLKTVLGLALPIVVTQYSIAIMQFVDGLMISGLGSGPDSPYTATTIPTLLILVIMSFGVGFLSSVATFVGQVRGRGERHKCGPYAWQGAWLGLAFGVLSIATVPSIPAVFAAFSDNPALLPLEYEYYSISIYSIAPALFAAAGSQYFIAIQKPFVSMAASVIANIANLLLDYGLIYGGFGLPEIGFAGAAWATVGASLLHALILAAVMLKQRHKGLGFRTMALDRAKIREMVKVGLPAGTQNALDIISWSGILIWFVSQYGAEHITAARTVTLCIYLSFLPAEGVCTALTALVAKAVGNRDEVEARTFTTTTAIAVAGYMVAVATLLYLFRESVFSWFDDTPEILRIATQAMLFVAVFQVFDALNIVYSHALRGCGDTFWPMVINTVLVLVVFVGGGFLALNQFPQYGSAAIWLVDGIYIMLLGLVFAVRWHRGAWKTVSIFGMNSPDPKSH